jgi:hypothetical protein
MKPTEAVCSLKHVYKKDENHGMAKMHENLSHGEG